MLLHLALMVLAQPAFDAKRLERTPLVTGLTDAMGIDVLNDGTVILIERPGGVLLMPPGQPAKRLGRVKAAVFGEVGLMGVAFDANFAQSGAFFIFYSPEEKKSVMRLSRLVVREGKIDPALERTIIEVPIEEKGAYHLGGGIARDAKGRILIGIGDNSPPIPELPIDQRPGHELADALRSAGNTNDLRGKILRVEPLAEGGYRIPEGNLFKDPKQGRPEIFAMGCRNPFRVMCDLPTGEVMWGDVGVNVDPKCGITPSGYDEINRTQTPGNFGWPLFSGPNEGFTRFDFETRKVGDRFDPAHPVNLSRNNTGAKELPPARGAAMWYSSVASERWPAVGAGSRSIVCGPVVRLEKLVNGNDRLPERYEGKLLVADWMRNWIVACDMKSDGTLGDAEPFAQHLSFRRPMDMRMAPDGSLLVLEYGDRWNGNTDGVLSRLAYKRGNRSPLAKAEANPPAGKAGLVVKLDASASTDADGDTLKYEWRDAAGVVIPGQGPAREVRIGATGSHLYTVTVTDAHGSMGTAQATVKVGNALPVVQIKSPVSGSFFDWTQPLLLEAEATDDEDGSTSKATIPADKIVWRAVYLSRGVGETETRHPGLALMRGSTCFGCHMAGEASRGPAYAQVGARYRAEDGAREKLTKKIVEGGNGAWGTYPMPPHPQHTPAQARQMVDWILDEAGTGQQGAAGALAALAFPHPGHNGDGGVWRITASYTDLGARGQPALTGEATVIVHARRRKAAFADIQQGTLVVDDIDKERDALAWLGKDSFVGFSGVRLDGVSGLRVRASSTRPGAWIEARSGGPDGVLLGKVEPEQAFAEHLIQLEGAKGIHDVVLVARQPGAGSMAEKPIGLHWIRFEADAGATKAEAAMRDKARPLVRAAATKSGPITPLKPWKIDDFSDKDLTSTGRDAAKGDALLTRLGCVGCHAVGTKAGGQLGPNIAESLLRVEKEKDPRRALLREILEPSRQVEPKWRTRVVVLDSGRTIAGLVLSQTDQEIRLVSDPTRPDQVQVIPRDRIEEMRETPASLMPAGLLDGLTREEVLDLMARLWREAKAR